MWVLFQTYLECSKTKFKKNYKGINPGKITTTVGLNIGNIDIHRVSLNFWDLGGQTELQSLWDKVWFCNFFVNYFTFFYASYEVVKPSLSIASPFFDYNRYLFIFSIMLNVMPSYILWIHLIDNAWMNQRKHLVCIILNIFYITILVQFWITFILITVIYFIDYLIVYSGFSFKLNPRVKNNIIINYSIFCLLSKIEIKIF